MSLEEKWRKTLFTFMSENKTRIESNKTIVSPDKVIQRTTIIGENSKIVWDTNKQTEGIEDCYLIQDQKNIKKV